MIFQTLIRMGYSMIEGVNMAEKSGENERDDLSTVHCGGGTGGFPD